MATADTGAGSGELLGQHAFLAGTFGSDFYFHCLICDRFSSFLESQSRAPLKKDPAVL